MKQPPIHGDFSLVNFSTMKMEAILSSETSVYTRSTRRHNPEDGILQTAVILKNNIIQLVFEMKVHCYQLRGMK
jgi:hypothetical protein